jgi:ABC-2 type transport system ATP-binding protein
MTSQIAIKLNNVSKRYGRGNTLAVNKLSLQVRNGEVYGFLGSNGAGKSTTIRMLLNFIRPTSGDISIRSLDSVKDSVSIKKHIGYLAGDVALYPKTTGNELLDLLGNLQGQTDTSYRAILEKRFEAETNKQIGELSKGNKQKIGIIQAFMHQPSVLVLDEPTSGLDPLMQERFYETVAEAKARGAAIFLSSHNLTEAQRICDRIGIIKDGLLVREETIDIASSLHASVLTVTFASADAVKKLKESKQLRVLNTSDTRLEAIITGDIASVMGLLSKYKIVDLRIEKPSLEDDFMTFYGDVS